MILTITNQKGGIGKTTTAQNLGFGLAGKGYKTLLIDLDGQRNLTIAAGANQDHTGSYEMMLNQASAKECIQHLTDNLDIITGNLALVQLDIQLVEMGKEYRLKEQLEPLKNAYDYIIIDTPPTLNITTMNALTAADSVLIPCQADIFSVDAVLQLYENTIKTVQKYTNPALKINGILLTRYNDRNILTRDITAKYEELAKMLKTHLYNAKIREAIAVKESQAVQQDILSYSGNSKVANDYRAFIEEFLTR